MIADARIDGVAGSAALQDDRGQDRAASAAYDPPIAFLAIE